MKRIVLTLIIASSLILTTTAQEKEEKLKELENLEQKTATETPDTLILDRDTLTVKDEEIIITDEEATAGDTSRIKIGEIVTVEDTGDETVIRIGHRGITVSYTHLTLPTNREV